ncbi:MAG: MaoC/PaaZ C-terminal domain-containing protein [Candidatus Binataceae bacterium]
MALNEACAGKQYPPVETIVTVEAIQKYARAYNDDNPYFFDANRPGGIVAPPMFGVTVTWQSVLQVAFDPEAGVDPIRLVHGEQDMEFLNPIRPGDAIESTSKIGSIETKSTGETMVIELNARNQRHEHVQKALFTIFMRGTGGKAPSAEARAAEPARGEPIVTVSQTIDKDQTYRYAEASGDRNPIHVDPNVAKMAGLPGIIVHGLCTMAFTSKVMIDKLCGGDPTRLKRLRVRFSRPVLPGQTIATKVWPEGERGGRKLYAYETYNPDGQAVIRGGIAEVAG